MKDLVYAVICVVLCIPAGSLLGYLVYGGYCAYHSSVC